MTSGARPGDRAERVWPAVIGIWLLAAIILTLTSIPAIVRLGFPDADDAMRLLEVRDWLAGQSWWDVSQHRLSGGHFAMHWSRLVDLPLAAVIAPLDPLFGPAIATRVAMTLVPLATLLAIMAGVAVLTRRVAGAAVARLAVALVPIAIPILEQVRPMRIDHHGWQVALATAAAAVLFGRPTRRAGALLGAVLAILVTVSMEGLPIVAATMAIAALAWAWRPQRWQRFLPAAGWSLAVTAALLHVVTRGPAMWTPSCDAVSPGWLAMLLVAAVGLGAATLAGRTPLQVRLGALALAGAAAAATLLLLAPGCLRGPFATMDPLVYRLWYLHVLEGRPVWLQPWPWTVLTIALPVVGLIGTGRAWREADSEGRRRWTMLLALSGAAFLLSLLVMRAGATANALAVPGAAVLLLSLLSRARRVEATVPRVFATVGAMLVALPGVVVGALLPLTSAAEPPVAALVRANGWHHRPCDSFSDLRVLDRLPAGTVFAPVDQSPEIIATTRQRAIAGGYHRNDAAMHRVFAAFTAAPPHAESLIRASQATYVAVCPGFDETEIDRRVAPDGLWARLERGERFAWLAPVALGRSPVLAWRIIGPAQRPLSEAPAQP